jgi:alcohol dehydrogenase
MESLESWRVRLGGAEPAGAGWVSVKALNPFRSWADADGGPSHNEAMRAACYHKFSGPIQIETLPDPEPPVGGVVIEVKASGLCRSDWHGWKGTDPDIVLPHVPGHELAGVIAAVGKDLQGWQVGDRVTLPFCCGCGTCPTCESGNPQICDRHFQPGFTAFGSFAQYVSIPYAAVNLVRLPEEVSFEVGSILGCRFVTSYRAVIDRGRASAGDWVAVHGCGGIGLSAIMVAVAAGARVVAVDIDAQTLELAKELGAEAVVDAASASDVPGAIMELTGGGAHVSLDALGAPVCAANSVRSLRKLGRHVQVGLLPDGATPLPMNLVIGRELELLGSHGLAAARYPEVLELVTSGRVNPSRLLGSTLSLDEVPEALIAMGDFKGSGVSVINRF